MAGKFHCRLNLSSFLICCVVFLERGIRLLGKAWSFSCVYYYQIGAAVAVLLAIMNMYAFNQGCRNYEAPNLPHGYAPLIPSHYYHQPLTKEKQDISNFNHEENLDVLDAYLNNNVVGNSLDFSVPPIVHIICCEPGHFKYHHYLSVLAAFKILKPSVLNLHVIEFPFRDADGYYQFLDDLKRDLPPLLVKQLANKRACSGDSKEKLMAILGLIGKEGGIALSSKAILVPGATIVSKYLEHEISIGQGLDTEEPLVVFLKSDVFFPSSDKEKLVSSANYFQCSEPQKFSLSPTSVCVSVGHEIFPVSTFQGSHHLNCLLRWVGYGSAAELVPKPSTDEIVPNIVHYVWLGKRRLGFFAYLSVMSALHVLKADAVYIHGDYEPEGDLWQEVKLDTHVKFIIRKFPFALYGQPIVKFASHASDFLRGDLLLRYGGVYADWDVIFVKEMPSILRRYNTTANVDWPHTGAFPDVFNLGVLISAPGAPFLRYFLESYRWYLDAHWSYNAIHMPYKVYEKVPWSLNVDRHLQVSAFNDVRILSSPVVPPQILIEYFLVLCA